jgi:hypothetical protein
MSIWVANMLALGLCPPTLKRHQPAILNARRCPTLLISGKFSGVGAPLRWGTNLSYDATSLELNTLAVPPHQVSDAPHSLRHDRRFGTEREARVLPEA